MSNRVELQRAFLLHMRAFRDSSVLADFFTQDYGRITVIAHGAKSAKSKLRGLLQPFLPLLISWSAKGELGNLSKVELDAAGYNLTGRNLIVGLYINELLTKLLHKHDAHPALFQAYQKTLSVLFAGHDVEQSLRVFEKKLLADLGYGLDFEHDVNGNKINPNLNYKFNFEHGFVVSNEKGRVFSGKTLLSLDDEDLADPISLSESKILMRSLIKNLLGNKKILSRELLSPVIPADAGIQRH